MARRTRLSVCQRKRRYITREEAIAAAMAGGWLLRPYRCDRCDRFHLTGRRRGHHTPLAIRLALDSAGSSSGVGASGL